MLCINKALGVIRGDRGLGKDIYTDSSSSSEFLALYLEPANYRVTQYQGFILRME